MENKDKEVYEDIIKNLESLVSQLKDYCGGLTGTCHELNVYEWEDGYDYVSEIENWLEDDLTKKLKVVDRQKKIVKILD